MDATDPSGEAIDPEYVCRRCDRPFSRQGDALGCPNCSLRVAVRDGIPRFPVPEGASSADPVFDRLATIYETPLWFAPMYRFIGGLEAPRDDRSLIAAMLDLEAAGAETESESAADGPAVLDVACGTGRLARFVAPDAGSVVGVDVSEGMLERARRYAARDGVENVAFARMSADELWVGDDAFDRVACCWALHLFPDVDAALAELRRVLRPGGRFVGTTIVDEYVLGAAPVRAVARRTVGADPFDAGTLRERLRAAGFSSVEFDRRGAALFFRARLE